MIEIGYWELFAVISVIWLTIRVIVGIKNKKVSFKREFQLILVYICFVVIARFVNFPLHKVNGHIDTMKFDPSRVFPLWLNVIPIVHLFDVYDGMTINILGNVTMFIPVGIVWPVCFKKLDTWWKAVLAGAGLTVFIEVTQLPFFERCSDIDDIILNTAGVAIGAGIVFAIRKRKPKD